MREIKREREPVNANDMNESFCVFADSMEKFDQFDQGWSTILLRKKYIHQVQHEYVSIEIFWNEKRGFITYLLVDVTCCVCLYFENTLCIYILLYIP